MYYFILGRNYLLSIAEILAVLNAYKATFNIVSISRDVLIIKTASSLDVDKLITSLGGVIKIGKIIGKVSELANHKKLSQLIITEFPRPLRKFFFGFSCYGAGKEIAESMIKKTEREIKQLAMYIKKELRKHDFLSRWVTSKESCLSSVVVAKNKLITEGAEICVLLKSNNFFIGKTLVVQPFETYSERDYGREYRDAKVGMIPPKLAQMMINLSSASHDNAITDPFCGTGTILQEAVLMGYTKVIGADKSLKAVESTKNNIYWIMDKFELKGVNFKLFHADVRNINSHVPANMVKAVVTEPYLGPPLTGKEGRSQVEKIIVELSTLYYHACQNFHTLLKKRGRVVMIWPVFNLPYLANGDVMHLPSLNMILDLGYRIIDPLGKIKPFLEKEEISSRGSLIYSREGQRVLREIFIFEKK